MPVATRDTMDERTAALVRAAIISTLGNYPNINKSMLTVSVRPYSKKWAEVLDSLVREGIVVREPVLRDSGRPAVIYRLRAA